jgi:hypothetical protein
MAISRRLDDPESFDPATEPPDPFAGPLPPITKAFPKAVQGPLPPGATGEAYNAPPANLRDTLASLFAMAYGGDDPKAAQAFGQQAGAGGDFLPLIGSISSGQQSVNDFKRGDAVGGGLNMLGALPELAPLLRTIGGAAERGGLSVLRGAPKGVEGPVPEVVKAAQTYADDAGIPLARQGSYAKVNPRRAGFIADAYDRMPHDPSDPKVAASYKALADETMGQWKALQDSGAKIEFLKPGMADPYPGGPRDALADLRANNHLYVFPSEQGFGSGEKAATDNPMLADTGIVHDGHNLLVNDAFRAVHDYFGHGMEGAHFGPRGEENAWQAHKALFSPEALPALTTETRGQNSWVNFGPHGAANQANPRETIFADQKAGLLPSWATREGGMPPTYRAQQVGTAAALLSALGLAGSSQRKE